MTNMPKDEHAVGRTDLGDKHGQATKVLCIIAPKECYIAGKDIFNKEKKKKYRVFLLSMPLSGLP